MGEDNNNNNVTAIQIETRLNVRPSSVVKYLKDFASVIENADEYRLAPLNANSWEGYLEELAQSLEVVLQKIGGEESFGIAELDTIIYKIATFNVATKILADFTSAEMEKAEDFSMGVLVHGEVARA